MMPTCCGVRFQRLGITAVPISRKHLPDGYASDFSTKIEAQIISGQLLRKL